jgi:hypothetical protein
MQRALHDMPPAVEAREPGAKSGEAVRPRDRRLPVRYVFPWLHVIDPRHFVLADTFCVRPPSFLRSKACRISLQGQVRSGQARQLSAGSSTLASDSHSRSPIMMATSASWPRCATCGEPPPQHPALALARTDVHALLKAATSTGQVQNDTRLPQCQPHPRPCPRGKGAGLWRAMDIGSLESCSLKAIGLWGARDIGSLDSCSLKTIGLSGWGARDIGSLESCSFNKTAIGPTSPGVARDSFFLFFYLFLILF